MITSDLNWSKHVQNICRRATNNLWVLIRFKALGGTNTQLNMVYQTRIRAILEFGSPVFHSSLMKDQSAKIELAQKKALAVILGKDYESYEYAMSRLNLERLDTRRSQLCLAFAQKCAKSTRHGLMFPKNTSTRTNMRHPKLYLEHSCSTFRYHHSSIPFMAGLLNRNC